MFLERAAFTRLLDAGFVDVWRKRNPEETGAYTYWLVFSISILFAKML